MNEHDPDRDKCPHCGELFPGHLPDHHCAPKPTATVWNPRLVQVALPQTQAPSARFEITPHVHPNYGSRVLLSDTFKNTSPTHLHNRGWRQAISIGDAEELARSLLAAVDALRERAGERQ